MLNLKSGKHFTDAPTMTRGGFLKGILASGIAPSITFAAIANAGSANATVGGMMRNVVARICMIGGESEPMIPYQKIEYIETSKTATDSNGQYINTGICPDLSTCEIYGEFYNGNYYNSYDTFFGVYSTITERISQGDFERRAIMARLLGNKTTFQFFVGANEGSYSGSFVNSSATKSITTETWYGIKTTPTECLVDGVQVLSYPQKYSIFDQPLAIFADRFLWQGTSLNNSWSQRARGKRCRKFTIKQGGELVRDFVPVRDGSVGYLYDKVSGTLFGNSGGGAFTLGPDI